MAALGLHCGTQAFSSCSEWGYCLSWGTGFSLQWLLLLRSTGSRALGLQCLQCVGSILVAHGLSCSAVCGIFPDQGLNLHLLLWQADSSPPNHQGNPTGGFFFFLIFTVRPGLSSEK